MKRKDFLIVFKNDNRFTIHRVTNYKISLEDGYLRVGKKNCEYYFNLDEIRCCGNGFGLNNKGD